MSEAINKDAISPETAEKLAEDLLYEKQTVPEMDPDGFALGDPYAQAAKMIDRKHGGDKSKGAKSKMVKVAKTILENKDTVKIYE